MKTFLRWAVKTGRLTVDPLASIAKPSPERDRRLVRRYLTHEEFGWLDVVTRQSEDLYGMSGWERALLYATAIQTGFRSSELRNLSRGKLMLHHQPPFILADGSKTKNGKSARQYLQPELASELKLMVESKVQGTPAFSMPEKSRVCNMFRRDLEAARVAWLESIKDEEKRREADEGDFLKTLNSEGEHLDFHALRHTTASWLIHCGADIKTVQVVMRHSDINLTMNRYGHLFPGAEADAVGRMRSQFDVGGKQALFEEVKLQRQCQQSGFRGVRDGAKGCDE